MLASLKYIPYLCTREKNLNKTIKTSKIMKTKKYFANMSVNNGTHLRPDLEGTNYRKLAKDISQIARGNCYVGNEYSWEVWDENDIIVAAGAGIKTKNGGFNYLDCSHLIGESI